MLRILNIYIDIRSCRIRNLKIYTTSQKHEHGFMKKVLFVEHFEKIVCLRQPAKLLLSRYVALSLRAIVTSKLKFDISVTIVQPVDVIRRYRGGLIIPKTDILYSYLKLTYFIQI